MIKIFAQAIYPEEQDLPIRPPLKPPAATNQPPLDIPLADDDNMEEMSPIGETQGVPVAPPPPIENIDSPDIPVPEPQDNQSPQPNEDEQAPFPEDEFEEIVEEDTELDKLNQTLPIQQKIDKALAEGYPLRVIYTTIKGNTTERTIRPDYYRPARSTGNWVLIAWCELRQDWRGFIVDRIRAAKLEPKQ